jgi:hypothetical protein
MIRDRLLSAIAVLASLQVCAIGCEAQPSRSTSSGAPSHAPSAALSAPKSAASSATLDGTIHVVYQSRQCFGQNGLDTPAVDSALRRGGIRSFAIKGFENFDPPVCQGCWPSCSINHTYRVLLPRADVAKARKIVDGLTRHPGGSHVTPNFGGKTVEVTLVATGPCTAAACGPKNRCCNSCGFKGWTIPSPDYAVAEAAPGTSKLPSCTMDGCGQCAFGIRATGSLIAHQKFVVSKWVRTKGSKP